MNKKIDFSKMDEVLPTAEKMQQEYQTAVALENNCKAVGILNEKVEKLENRLAEALSALDGAVSSFYKASRATVGEESRRVLEQEGDAIFRKMTDRVESERVRLAGCLSANDRVLISMTTFRCMV